MDKTEPVAPLEVIPPKSAAHSFRRLMKNCKNFFLSSDINTALLVTSQSKGDDTVLADDTEGMILLRQGYRSQADNLVDITSTSERKRPQQDQKEISINAAGTYSNTLHALPLLKHIHEMAQASDLIGDPQVHPVDPLNRTISHILPVTNGRIAFRPLDVRVESTTLNNR